MSEDRKMVRWFVCRCLDCDAHCWLWFIFRGSCSPLASGKHPSHALAMRRCRYSLTRLLYVQPPRACQVFPEFDMPPSIFTAAVESPTFRAMHRHPTSGLEFRLPPSVLQREDAPLNRVQQNVTRLEVRIHGPSPEKLDHIVVVVLGVAVKEAHFLKVAARGVTLNTGNVNNAQPRGVVGLVGQALDNLYRRMSATGITPSRKGPQTYWL